MLFLVYLSSFQLLYPMNIRDRVRARDSVRVGCRLLGLNSMFRLWFRFDNDHTKIRSNHSVSDRHRMQPSQSDLSATKIPMAKLKQQCLFLFLSTAVQHLVYT